MIGIDTEQEVVRLRQNGTTVHETALLVGVSESSVVNIMRRHGLAGKIVGKAVNQATPSRPGPKMSIDAAIFRFGSVYIEEGLDGGYIATVGEKWTGDERDSIGAAVRSAAIRAEEAVA